MEQNREIAGRLEADVADVELPVAHSRIRRDRRATSLVLTKTSTRLGNSVVPDQNSGGADEVLDNLLKASNRLVDHRWELLIAREPLDPSHPSAKICGTTNPDFVSLAAERTLSGERLLPLMHRLAALGVCRVKILVTLPPRSSRRALLPPFVKDLWSLFSPSGRALNAFLITDASLLDTKVTVEADGISATRRGQGGPTKYHGPRLRPQIIKRSSWSSAFLSLGTARS